jgi:uncharacterized protein (TIGR03435 family)
MEEALRKSMGEFLTGFTRGRKGHKPLISGISASVTMVQLCQMLEGALDLPVIDETNLEGAFALNVHTESPSTLEFLRALTEATGLVATPDRREVEMLVCKPNRGLGV